MGMCFSEIKNVLRVYNLLGEMIQDYPHCDFYGGKGSYCLIVPLCLLKCSLSPRFASCNNLLNSGVPDMCLFLRQTCKTLQVRMEK